MTQPWDRTCALPPWTGQLSEVPVPAGRAHCCVLLLLVCFFGNGAHWVEQAGLRLTGSQGLVLQACPSAPEDHCFEESTQFPEQNMSPLLWDDLKLLSE